MCRKQIGDHVSVMIVEDDSDIRESLESALEIEGYHSVTAQNGLEAVNLLEHGTRPCLILLDLMMPVMDGWEFLDRRAHEEPEISNIPVVVVSAAGERMQTPMAQSHLKKPVDLDRLIEIVDKYCNGFKKIEQA
jgi:two-component system chemotaxis response regulator CheY